MLNCQLVKLNQLLFDEHKLWGPAGKQCHTLWIQVSNLFRDRKGPVEDGTAIHMLSIAFWHSLGTRFGRKDTLIPDPKVGSQITQLKNLPIPLQLGKEELVELVSLHLKKKAFQVKLWTNEYQPPAWRWCLLHSDAPHPKCLSSWKKEKCKEKSSKNIVLLFYLYSQFRAHCGQ